jgi:hypothetical protein
MHDAKLTSLSKIEVGQTILVTPEQEVSGIGHVAGRERKGKFRGFARPKDLTGIVREVVAKDYVPDEWSGKVWTLTLSDKTKTEPRYGTTHVYVVDESAVPDYHLVETESGDKHVLVTKGVARVQGWSGGDVHETTPDGIPVHIAPDGVITVVELDGTERPPKIKREIEDHPTLGKVKVTHVPGHGDLLEPLSDTEADKRNAGKPDLRIATGTTKCGKCKGFGVVRKYGKDKGLSYKTANGADQATANGNSEICPACKGEALVSSKAA